MNIKHKHIEEETEIKILKKTSFIAIIAVLITTLLTSTAQILWKIGTATMDSSNISTIIFNPYIWAGFMMYGIGALIMVVALKRGELSVLYPIIALSYVWVALAAHYFVQGDSMNSVKWMGIGLIVMGVSFIGIGSQLAAHKEKKSKGED